MTTSPGPPERALSEHRRAWDLIPWVVTGSAAADEQTLVHAHAARCDECRDELAFHQRLLAGVRGGGGDGGGDGDEGLERGWQAMQRRLDAPGAAPRRRGAVPALAAVVAVQAVALAALAGLLWQRLPSAPYQTLSRTAPAALPPASIRFVPSPQMTHGALQALLARQHLQLVQTSADGAYFGLAAGPGAAATRALQIEALRREPGVLLAEPVGGEAP